MIWLIAIIIILLPYHWGNWNIEIHSTSIHQGRPRLPTRLWLHGTQQHRQEGGADAQEQREAFLPLVVLKDLGGESRYKYI